MFRDSEKQRSPKTNGSHARSCPTSEGAPTTGYCGGEHVANVASSPCVVGASRSMVYWTVLKSAVPIDECFTLPTFVILHGNECNSVCPFKPDFSQRLAEVNGLCFDNLAEIAQECLSLPQYIPLIHHGYRRNTPLDWPVVAIETYEVFRLLERRYQAIAQTPDELREAFCLAPGVKILLLGTADDLPLERYWEYRRRDDAARQLARLRVLAAIGPNFSHFLDVPRTDNLFNRKRQLICLEELHRAGICPDSSSQCRRTGRLAFLAAIPHHAAIRRCRGC